MLCPAFKNLTRQEKKHNICQKARKKPREGRQTSKPESEIIQILELINVSKVIMKDKGNMQEQKDKLSRRM